MKLITLKFDEETGEVTDANGISLGYHPGIEACEAPKGVEVRDLVKLKEAGYSADDIAQLCKCGAL